MNQHALVTGGGSGIGLAIAEALAGAGCRVTIGGRNEDRLQKAADRIAALPVGMDVTDPESVKRAFENARQTNGPVGILVNNAGAVRSAPFHRTEAELWRSMIEVNLNGVYRCTREVVTEMKDGGFGRIVNVASTAALKGYAYVSAYCAAKHGVLGLTRALAVELAATPVTVNAVCPGYTDTDLVRESLDRIVEQTGRGRDEALADLLRDNPQQRLIEPEEVAAAVMWLCGDASAAVTGQAIAVAGGEVM